MVHHMGTKALTEDEARAAPVLSVALQKRVVSNEDGTRGKCDLRVVSEDGAPDGYAEVTQLVGEELAKTTSNLGGGKVLGDEGRLGSNWWIEVESLSQARWEYLAGGGLTDLLERAEDAGLEWLPTTPTLARVSSEIPIAESLRLRTLADLASDCAQVGVVSARSTGSSSSERHITVMPAGSTRAGWPGSGAAKVPIWLNLVLDQEKVAKKVRKLRATGAESQQLYLWISPHPDTSSDIEMYLSDPLSPAPTGTISAPNHPSDIWLCSVDVRYVVRWNKETGWDKLVLDIDDIQTQLTVLLAAIAEESQ